MKSDNLKKNLFDLEYSKYLQFYNTTLIFLLTYLAGLIISILNKQINLNDRTQLAVLVIISIVLISITLDFLLVFKNMMNKIIRKIKRLEL